MALSHRRFSRPLCDRIIPAPHASCTPAVPPFLLAFAASACTAFVPHPSIEPGDAGGLADASADATDAASEATAACDPTTDPTTALCLTSESGLFVSPAGSDASGDGSPAHPFATVGHALATPNSAGRIYVCAGQYPERVALAPGATANLYGGLSCPDADDDASGTPLDGASPDTDAGWAPGGNATVFSPPTYDPTHNWVLAIDGVASVTIQNVQFVAPAPSGTDAEDNGNSSFAAVVLGSSVQFVGATITAGRGVDGSPGPSGAASSNYSEPIAPAGTPACQVSPAPGGVQTCANEDSSMGGSGADNMSGSPPYTFIQPTAGSALPEPPPVTDAGLPHEDGLPPSGGLIASNPSTYAAALVGDPGAPGQPRPAGIMATTVGVLTSTATSAGWQPTAGGAGSTGKPGQGGGGGAGLDTGGEPSQGGGGGAGGCGGTGGGGGAGGGASVALLSIQSSELRVSHREHSDYRRRRDRRSGRHGSRRPARRRRRQRLERKRRGKRR